MRRSPIAVACLVTVALLGASCGSDQDPSIPAPDDTSSSTTADVTSTTAGTAGFEGSTAPVSAPSTGPKQHLTDVRVAGHDGYERVAFEFRDGVPGYSVRYVERPIVEDGSGNEVTVAGEAVIEVRMEPASGFDADLGDGGQQTYTGPRRIDAPSDAITEVVRTGDFEAVLTWVIGVDRERPFRVTVANAPKPVLIIDVGTS